MTATYLRLGAAALAAAYRDDHSHHVFAWYAHRAEAVRCWARALGML